jgi:hypothetical protein
MHRRPARPAQARRLHAHPHASRNVLFGINYPMICHEPALADLDAFALDDAAPTALLECHALSCLAARGGLLHRPGDAQAEPREADVRRGAAASVTHRAAGLPRTR